MKELPEKFEGQFECLGENKEKYITFSVPRKKNLKIIRQSHITITSSSLIALDLCQVHYQVLLIILLKGFTIINVRIVGLILNISQPKMNY